MPDRTYVMKEPPSFLDRLFHHPFEMALSAVLLLVGARFIINPDLLPGSVQELPWVTTWLFILCAPLGGLLTLLGLLSGRAKTFGMEQAGLSLSAAAWFSYALLLMDASESTRAALMVGALLALSFAHVLRVIALRRLAVSRLRGLRQAR